MAKVVGAASPEVDDYIARCPADARNQLSKVRAAIRSTVPDATELISYKMPGYSYEGYEYGGIVAWFGLQSRHIGLYLRPPTIADHPKELKGYSTTKSAVHLPLERDVPIALVKKLVLASLRTMKARGRDTPPRRRRTKPKGSRRA